MSGCEQELITEGYCVVENLLDETQRNQLLRAIPNYSGAGTRTLLGHESFRILAKLIAHHPKLEKILENLHPVQCTFFIKNLTNNWSVQMHRDKVIAIGGSGPWQSAGIREGLHCVKPPISFMNRCLAVRVTLDDCSEGDLQIVAGSHDQPVSRKPVIVQVARLGALVLRPRVLHASKKLVAARSRRVLHYLFAPPDLPQDYHWYFTDR